MPAHGITKISAEKILDSRGNPTLKVSVFVENISGSFAVPAGASTGKREAQVVSVENAIENIEKIIGPNLVGKSVLEQQELDKIMLALDGTDTKEKLGGNTLIGTSIAIAKTAAKTLEIPTFEYLRTLYSGRNSISAPYLFMNLLNGGKHAKNSVAFQEYMIVPQTNNVKEALDIGAAMQKSLADLIVEKHGPQALNFGDEGGFAVHSEDVREPLQMLQEAAKRTGATGKVRFALDVAATSFFEKDQYQLAGASITSAELLDIYKNLCEEFDLLSIEDPFEENDFGSFKTLQESQNNLLVVGDDLTVTNKKDLIKAIKQNSINAMIIKPNQVGTLSETIDTIQLAQENDIKLIASHRSGETDDDFIADLAFAFGCFGLKAGSPSKPERMVKYKRLENICKNNS